MSRNEPFGIYIHIPYCRSKCRYCDFYSAPGARGVPQAYVGALLRELAKNTRRPDTLYFGGGTPALLSPGQVSTLIQAADPLPGAEITLEANPDVVTPETLLGFRQAGVNRISFGVQSADDAQLQRLGRTHTAAGAARALAWAQEAGVTLTEEDQAALEAQRQAYVEYYGGEEAYQQQLAAMGLTEEAYDRIPETAFLYQRLETEFSTEGSALYPDGAALAQYAADNGYLTGRAIYVPAGDGAEEEANGYLKRMQEAEDKLAEHAAICQERGVDQKDSITFTVTEGDPVCEAAMALAANEVSDVIAVDEGYYIFLREETDLSAVLPAYFNALLQARRGTANVVYNEELYAAIDTGTFYQTLTQLRSQLAQTVQPTEK